MSRAVALAMATGARTAIGSDVGVAITGMIAGGTGGKPPGLTYVAVATLDGRTKVERFGSDHGAGRNDERGVRIALQLVLETLQQG